MIPNFYETLKVLAQPSRTKIIYALYLKPLYVNEICTTCNLSQANVSKHLKMLLDNEIVLNKKESKNILYTINGMYFKRCKIIKPMMEMYSEHEDGVRIKNTIEKES